MPAPYVYIQDDEKLAELAELLHGAADITLACDTETTGLDPLEENARLLLLQIAVPDNVSLANGPMSPAPGTVYVINACKCDMSIITPVLTNGRLTIWQNAKFDLKWLRAKCGIDLRRVFDTMIAELILESGVNDSLQKRRRQASLKALASKYLNQELDKAPQKHFIGWRSDDFPEYMLQYAADDVPLLFQIMKTQAEALKNEGLFEVAKLEFSAVSTIAKMELNGLGIQPAMYRAITEKARDNMISAEHEVKDILGTIGAQRDLWDDVTVNINANGQLLTEFARIGVSLKNCDETALKMVIQKHTGGVPAQLAETILKYREFQKLVSTYGDKVLDFIHPITGRIHSEYQQLGSDAGRFSCDSPNIQQIPATKEYRSCFVPLPGNIMVVGDWSQFELRILCAFSGDQAMLEAFLAGRDLHSDTAARMYGLAYEDIDKHHPARQDAKILNFALCYGMGPTSLSISLKCTVEEARDKIKRYFQAYPGVEVYLKKAARSAVETGETRTLMGRRRLMPAPTGTGEDYRAAVAAIERKGKNTPIQGSNADFLKATMVEVEKRLIAVGIGLELHEGIVACVHDEIVLEVPKTKAEEAKTILEECMSTIPKPYMGAVPVKADVGIVPCWSK